MRASTREPRDFRERVYCTHRRQFGHAALVVAWAMVVSNSAWVIGPRDGGLLRRRQVRSIWVMTAIRMFSVVFEHYRLRTFLCTSLKEFTTMRLAPPARSRPYRFDYGRSRQNPDVSTITKLAVPVRRKYEARGVFLAGNRSAQRLHGDVDLNSAVDQVLEGPPGGGHP